MSDMDALVEKAARAISRLRTGTLWPDTRREAHAALEAVGLPALLERVEAAEGEVADLTEKVEYWVDQRDLEIERGDVARENCDALAAEVTAALKIHRPWSTKWARADHLRCDECLDEWPCATARALGVTA